ncbi:MULTISPECIES: Rieske 2Fe-2S domain-containing protein [Mycobacterium]|uniref:cholesterol 7-desaturase n=1 Tax=Mycobacterium kiyosense TaxID=2871094 RepID=A0A9P3V0L7_9MYCO|nr:MULTISPECIES: Rieske 2Fe-2S domain-containing protein [Mycobacterium]BDB41183.1 (2Fe-2S) ferredoxin [Mycobacterium kiyosense]BDE12974.1 (2Fe-2S) ferredoxin [Mycobacterium sp. 20KCMC460]GLB85567.1 (2Fe-2S) ferredoxin [Mycobacterium kiyosense]GLB92357.1 (2Fe-2S) ferredoxin [Mycobacterium kiyosense]GLB98404.1 (2Fe-2S) ferredoxin [Mycobacterium kiyosense]
MAKPPLSMKPTGWFQVAWSDEIGIGDVHTMKYFDQEMVAWRAESGQLTVMNAYCEHLGAHLGYGGKVVGDVLQCPFHGWQWSQQGRNVCIPYQDRPNRGRRIRTYPVVERNESVYIWHDIECRPPFFDAPDVFASFADGSGPADYYPQQRLFRQGLEMHPQYVLENGVDFAHFKYVHNTPIVPVFTRHDFDDAVSYVDFTITFEGDDQQSIDDVKSGVEAINGGLGIAVTKSWGMIDNRTISAITPVDERTSDVRFMVYIGRVPGRPAERAERDEANARSFGAEVIRQFTQDIHIWAHQRYSDPPALASAEYEGFTAIRNWAKRFYPDGKGGTAAELAAANS